jgi:aspartate/methionine/tyrosine aminotransferase
VPDKRADDTHDWAIAQEDDMTPDQVKQAVTDALSEYKVRDTDTDGWLRLPSFIRNRLARRADVGFARDQLVAAVKAGQQAGADADADAIVDAIADRIAKATP